MRIRSSRTLLFLFICVIAVSGCRKGRTPQLAQAPQIAIKVDPPPPTPEPEVVPVEEPLPPDPPEDPLKAADLAYATGDYKAALPLYTAYVDAPPQENRKDEVLFKLAMIYALSPPPIRDWSKSIECLNKIAADSSFKQPAALIVSLYTDLSQATADTQKRERLVRQLQDENDKLKKIDADRRRRP